MRSLSVAFATGALASGLVGGGLAGIIIWIVTIAAGSADPWSVAPAVVALTAAIVAAATYVAEGVVYRRSLARMRAIGEPWAFRED